MAYVPKKSLVVVTGGSNEVTKGIKRCDFYDLATDQWSSAPALNERRTSHASCAIQGFVYVCGGHDGKEARNSIERLDLRSHTKKMWETLPFIKCERGREDPMIAPLNHSEILIVGGIEKDHKSYDSPQTSTTGFIIRHHSKA